MCAFLEAFLCVFLEAFFFLLTSWLELSTPGDSYRVEDEDDALFAGKVAEGEGEILGKVAVNEAALMGKVVEDEE